MENRNDGYNRLRSTCAQMAAALSVNCMMINVAMIIGMPTLVIGALSQDDHNLSFTEDQESWFGGLLFVVQPVGSVFSGLLQDRLGRKACMMMVNIPVLFGWLTLYFANSVLILFTAVTILGLSIGFMEAPSLSYIGEISEPRLRGVLGTLSVVFLNFGFLIVNLIGSITDWRSMTLCCSVAPVVTIFIFCLVPDSPAWLVSQGREEDARKAVQWLRGWVPPQAVRHEIDALVTYVRDNRKTKEYIPVTTTEGGSKDKSAASPPQSQLEIFLDPSVQRPLRLIVVYFFVSGCAGLVAIRPFFIQVVTTMQVPVRPHLVIVGGTVLTLLGSLVASLSMRRVGKRGLTFWSLGLSILCSLGLGAYTTLNIYSSWIPLTLFCINFFVVPLGITSIPWMLISELFPLRGRGLAGGLTAAIGYLLLFLIIKTFHNVVAWVSLSGAYFLYGGVGVVGIVYFYFCLPETEGVPLEIIESFFSDDKKSWNKKSQRHKKPHGNSAV